MQQAVLSIADMVVRSPLVRWTWSGLSDYRLAHTLSEFRPADIETVHEMMAGRYLLASKLVDTQGLSPFAIASANEAWRRELHGFSWLRHFTEAHSSADRRFARTLAMDWISRNGKFEARNWAPSLTAVRVLNWLRHLPLLIEDSTQEQARAIRRSLGTQVQSLRLRGGLSGDPAAALFVAIALAGAALCEEEGGKQLPARLDRLKVLLDEQIDADGLHLSRNARVQFELLTELVSVRQALGQHRNPLAGRIAAIVDSMHQALHRLTLGSGEPAYFNGCGQLPVDLVIAVQSHGGEARVSSGVMSGYGILRAGPASIIADSGLVPPTPHGAEAHAGALSFEFSHGSDLVLGNCGPSPADLGENQLVFRQGAAHSGPTIDGLSAAKFIARGPFQGRLKGGAQAPEIRVDAEECAMEIETPAFAEKFGVRLKRNLTLIANGATLVGQDRMLPAGRSAAKGRLTLRFHLAPGAEVLRRRDEAIIQVTLKSGAVWTFLWEGGTAQIEDSVRQSAYFGFFRTRQIAIETEVGPNREISWIFTRQSS